MSMKMLLESYRCPAEYLENFEIEEGLAEKPGYFRLGAEAIFFGRYLPHAEASAAQAQEIGQAREPVIEDHRVVLSFDPDEVVDNLRLERYPGTRFGLKERLLKATYYELRHFLSDRMRVSIQKLRASGWEKRKFPRWPVDTAVEDLCEDLLGCALRASGVENIPFVWFWPAGASGCVLMTHDVETTRGVAFCDELMRTDLAFAMPASFQIVPEERYPVEPEFLAGLRRNGFEVCVQDLNHDGRLFDDRNEFLRRTARINEYGRSFQARGYRTGALYRNPEWYDRFDFSFDMTIPNVAPIDPQRGGCCTVRPYFIGKILEIPLTTVQDYTLFYVLQQPTMDLWKQQVEKILSRNGLASFIVHPDYVRRPERLALYRQLLVYLREIGEQRNLWFARPSEIDEWWRDRSRMKVVRKGDGWSIEGQGAERAVLAYASLVDGKVVYRLTPVSSPAELRPSVTTAERMPQSL